MKRILYIILILITIPYHLEGDDSPEDLFSRISTKGVGGELQAMKQFPLSLQDAIKIALTQNPTVRQAVINYMTADYMAKNAFSPFSPTLQFQAGPMLSYSQNRMAYIYSRIPVAYDNQNPRPVDVSLPNGGRGLIWVPEPTEFKWGKWPITASGEYESLYYNTRLVLSKQFAWGPRLNMLKLETNYWRKPYGDLPYTVNLGLGFDVPLFKGFGAYGSQETVYAKTQNLNVSSSYWQLRATLNNVVFQTISTYYELLGTYTRLQYLVNNRQILAALIDTAQERRKQGRSTSLEDNLYQTEYLGALQSEEQAITNHLQISTYLRSILALHEEMLLVPTEELDFEPTPYEEASLDSLIQTALQNRPELHVTDVDMKKAMIQLNYAHNQNKPNLSIFTNVDLVEKGPYGYESFTKALRGAFNADGIFLTAGISYTFPWQDDHLDREVEIARINKNSINLTREQQVHEIKQAVKNAWLEVKSYAVQIEYSRESVELQDKISDEYKTLREYGRGVNEYQEFFSRQERWAALQNYLETKLNYVRARARLMAAQGILIDQYQPLPEWIPIHPPGQTPPHRIYPTRYFNKELER